MADQQNTIKSSEDFQGVGADQKRLETELSAALKNVEKWKDRAKKIIERFLDKREDRQSGDTRLNLFSSNIQTRRALMYGKTPRCEVTRRYDDANDAIARVGSNILDRLLNLDLESDSDSYSTALGLARDDWDLVGLGQSRVRYEAEFQTVPETPAQTHPDTGEELAPAVPEHEEKTSEEVEVDYVHWRDFLWTPARVWSEVRIIFFKAYMTRDQVKDRFGGDKVSWVTFSGKGEKDKQGLENDPWDRGEIWECWDKDQKKVYWIARGARDVLDSKDDPLGLEGFFPCPEPLVANLTSDGFMPVPEFTLAQDLYDEIDYVSTRITWLERAVKVVGVYDASNDGIQRMLQEGVDNDLIPVSTWSLLMERGGIKGAVDFMPLDQIVGALQKLREYRTELMQLLYEVTGMSDIMRGASNADETATAQAIKAKFASTRMQAAQDAFARFATDLLRLKAEVICKHCDEKYIIEGSNIQNTYDAQLASQAVQFLKSNAWKFRIDVKSEALSIQNFKELQSERVQVLQGLTTFLQASAPMFQQMPEAAPYLLEMLKWTISGFRGSSSIESVLDQAIEATKQKLMQPPPPPQPDPSIQAKQDADKQKAQLDVGVAKAKAGIEISKLQQKNHIDQQKLAIDAQKAQMQMQNFAQQTRLEAERAVLGRDAPEAQPPGQR